MKFHNKKIRRCSRSGGSNFNVHSFQRLEDRRLLATFTVTNTVDEVVMAAGDSPGSLRQAIFDANALAGADTITFDSSVFTGGCLLYTSPSPRDKRQSRMPSSA